MKKFLSFRICYLAMVLLLIMSFLSGCATNQSASTGQQNSTGNSATTVSGKYTLFEVRSESGEVLSAEEFDADEFSLTFNSDGTGRMISEGEFQDDFSWTQSGNKISIYIDGESCAATVDGNTISLYDDFGEGDLMMFRK